MLKLCLAQLDNRTEAEIVTSLCQLQREVRLLQQLICNRHTLKRRVRGQPRGVDVSHNPRTQVADALLRSALSQRCFLRVGAVPEAVEDGDLNTKSDGAIPVLRKVLLVAHWC